MCPTLPVKSNSYMLETPFWASCWGVKLTYLEIRWFHDSFQIANNHAFSLVFTNTKRTNETKFPFFPSISCYILLSLRCYGSAHTAFLLSVRGWNNFRIAWKAILWGLRVAPDHREEPRTYEWNEDVRGIKPKNRSAAWRAVHREKLCVKANHVQPSRLARITIGSIRGHPLLRRVCTSVLPYGQALCGVLIVLPSRQFRTYKTWTNSRKN